ncbi:hypothetical protein BEP19_15420 [Ammoniphilus oxalaticus]|uniref:DUF4181 domain-containing protein n=1 Tax=Ammoniphilus oxalaticus TaxID=66863 RepID=A0A419SDA2_9BACL|nr:hypothetical protein [Ammoniphilus oxalaticus]RKD21066.1 hypothetical protein BEP19_15420 [Ammoniphilus oxalaticus]
MFKTWKGRRLPFLALDILLIIFIFHAILITLMTPLSLLPLVWGILGLAFLNQGVEMFVTNKRQYFVLTLSTSVFLIFVSVYQYFGSV